METKNFNKLFAVNVNEKTEQKEGLTYLSWAWAWTEFKKVYPEATYRILKNEQGLPYFKSDLGFMVYTEVTAEGLTYEMWLPVMDSKNKAMKDVAYNYKTKFGEKSVEPATMTEINKAVMRCLTKNLAMFGLGLYIYAGEDLPSVDGEPTVQAETSKTVSAETSLATAEQREQLAKLGVDENDVAKYFKKTADKLTVTEISWAIARKSPKGKTK
ncbi:MAG: DUF1071 domain-containing protein [Clostridia bacterium]